MFVSRALKLVPTGTRDLFYLEDAVNLQTDELNKAKHKVPVFGFAKTHSKSTWGLHPDGIVLIPCFTLSVFLAPNIGRWRSVFETSPKVADQISWENRIDKLMWRGARTGDRQWLTGIGERKNDPTLDIEFIEWKHGKLSPLHSDNFKTVQDYCRYKYLLHQEGWSYSNRLKYLMLCGSPVLYANFQGWEEYWYHLLKPDYNILVFKDKGDERSFRNLTRSIMQNAKKAIFVGNNGRALIEQYLSEQAVLCYFRNVLIRYAKLFAYKPLRHPAAVTIDEFLTGYSS
jgi:EGF-domain serine glucosyl/xylosyltransferase